MYDSGISKSGRILTGIMGVMVLLVVLFSALFIELEADHDCTGDGCPICVCIQQCEKTLRQISNGSVILATALLFSAVIVLPVFSISSDILQNTLVSRKVRLDN
ncbi:MAG: hypothetical protein IJW67_09220 [Blautia sp.]|nr:hypothetical protein [Blautia sp.]